MNPKVDFYFVKAKKYQQELQQLRSIVLAFGLTEEQKWGVPCYTFAKRNIVLIHSFKEYCALMFFKGALLNDVHQILIQQTENVQAARQLRFNHLSEIKQLEPVIKSYIFEAVEIENAGLKVALKKPSAFTVTEELLQKFNNISGLKEAFEALTPGRQRAYHLYFAAPKQAKTRETRIEKCIALILDGKGLND